MSSLLIVTVKELQGYANINTIMRYDHSNGDAKRQAVSSRELNRVVRE